MKRKVFLILNLFVHIFSADLACNNPKIEDLEKKYHISTVRKFNEANYLTKSLDRNSNLRKSMKKKILKY